jgi:hypothetical protein
MINGGAMREIVYITEDYTVRYEDRIVGYYREFSDGRASFETALGSPWELEAELKAMSLEKNKAARRGSGPSPAMRTRMTELRFLSERTVEGGESR